MDIPTPNPEPRNSSEALDRVLALGPEKLTGIVAAALVAIGFFAPDAQAETGGVFGGTSQISFNLTQAGLAGVIVLLVGVALGLSPFFLRRERFSSIVSYGLSCAIFGALLIAWCVTLSLPAVVMAVGHLAIGFYSLLVGYGLNVYLMSKRIMESP